LAAAVIAKARRPNAPRDVLVECRGWGYGSRRGHDPFDPTSSELFDMISMWKRFAVVFLIAGNDNNKDHSRRGEDRGNKIVNICSMSSKPVSRSS